jgi:uncharacterized membrane protein
MKWLWMFLHQPGPLQFGRFFVFVAYPLIPWIGVMAAGYVFGPVLLLEERRRRTVLVGLGIGMTLAFIALRATNLYGDPNPWTPRPSPLFTVMSFVNCQKYPPSLLFLLMTLGPALLALAMFDRGVGPLGRPLVTLGRVPMFFYLLQWPVAHGLAVVVTALRGQPVGWMFGAGPGTPVPPDYGYSLPVVYLMWVVVLILLYPACAWFAALKRRRRDAWLSYL